MGEEMPKPQAFTDNYLVLLHFRAPFRHLMKVLIMLSFGSFVVYRQSKRPPGC